MANILIVEDNLDYQELLQNFLENVGHKITTAKDGEEAIHIATHKQFDLILLDLMLPKIAGYDVCREIRNTQDIPIIMLTALGSEYHQIKGYDLKIDDYITKPVSMTLLIQKVDAVLRRTMKNELETLCFHEIELNPKTHTVSVAGVLIEFTLREFEILYELMKSPGEVITRKFLIDALWEYDFYGDTRIVDTHIKNIRRKLVNCDYIETVRGIGYKLRKDNV